MAWNHTKTGQNVKQRINIVEKRNKKYEDQKNCIDRTWSHGCIFAPRLYEAFGDDFYIIAGGERKKRLESKGVTINGVNYRFPIVTPEEQGEPADLILIGVKGYGFVQAIEDIRHQVGEHTLILSLLNGVDSEEQLIQAFGEEHVLYAYMRMSIVMKDGKADFDPYWGKIHFGEKKMMFCQIVYLL